MKKIISLLLAVVMCFSMATIAFAEEMSAETDTTNTTVSKDSIMSVLVNLAKVASNLNDESRKALSEQLEKAIVDKIAGDSSFLQGAAGWMLDSILKISGSDNLLDLDKAQAESLAEILLLMYDGNLADITNNPLLKVVIAIIPKDAMKSVVTWFLSDGFGDALDDFIEKNENAGTENKPSDTPVNPSTPSETPSFDINAVISTITKVFTEMVNMLKSLLGSMGNQQTQPVQ